MAILAIIQKPAFYLLAAAIASTHISHPHSSTLAAVDYSGPGPSSPTDLLVSINPRLILPNFLRTKNPTCNMGSSESTHPPILKALTVPLIKTTPGKAPSTDPPNKTTPSKPPSPTPPSAGPPPPPKAFDIPELKTLFEKEKRTYRRDSKFLVEARLASDADLPIPLITYITTSSGQLLIETTKTFTQTEIDSGIVILRYPWPIGTFPNTDSDVFNEWYITLQQWREQYHGEPKKDWAKFLTVKPNKKVAIKITKDVIRMLGGEDETALISAPWGGAMHAIEGGLLTAEGSSIGPLIVEHLYLEEEENAGNAVEGGGGKK